MKLTEYKAQTKRQLLKKLGEHKLAHAVDKPLIPVLEQLNSIPGVCTAGCCIGHMIKSPHYTFPFVGHGLSAKGYVAFWLREDKEELFEKIIPSLLKKCICVKTNFTTNTLVGMDGKQSLYRTAGKTASLWEPVKKNALMFPQGTYKTYEVWWDYNMFWYFKGDVLPIILQALKMRREDV